MNNIEFNISLLQDLHPCRIVLKNTCTYKHLHAIIAYAELKI